MAKHKVLSTKKLEPSLIEQAKQNQIEIIEQEAVKIISILSKEKCEEVFRQMERKKQFAVFTSSNAVIALKNYLDETVSPFQFNWQIFSLSGKTKEVLDDNSQLFGAVIGSADHSKGLAEKIVSAKVEEVIFFCGNKRREELPNFLKSAGIKVHEVVVYQTVETPVISNDDVEAVLFFSPSAVQSFFSINQLKKNVVCFAIGQTTANSISAFTNNKIVVVGSPSQKSMLASLNFFFKT